MEQILLRIDVMDLSKLPSCRGDYFSLFASVTPYGLRRYSLFTFNSDFYIVVDDISYTSISSFLQQYDVPFVQCVITNK